MRNVVTINAVIANVATNRQARQVVAAGMATLRTRDLAHPRLYAGKGKWSKQGGLTKPSYLESFPAPRSDFRSRHAAAFCRHERPHELGSCTERA